MKIHHCVADGIAAATMLAALCDDGIGDRRADHDRAEQAGADDGSLLPFA